MIPMIGRMNFNAGTDCQRWNESIPARHRRVAGITSNTIPGSKMIARRCFHIVVAHPSQSLFMQSSAGSAYSCSSGSIIMGTAGHKKGGDIHPQAPLIRGESPCWPLRFR